MKIAIVGNRYYWTREEIFKILDEFDITNEDIIISGGALGVDTRAQEYARIKGCEMRVFYPNPNEPIPGNFFARNVKIAKECDMMIAFNKKGDSGGTNHAIKQAIKFGKDVKVFTGDKIYR